MVRTQMLPLATVSAGTLLADLGLGPEDLQDFLLAVQDCPALYSLVKPKQHETGADRVPGILASKGHVRAYLRERAQQRCERNPAHIDMIWSYLDSLGTDAQLVCVMGLAREGA